MYDFIENLKAALGGLTKSSLSEFSRLETATDSRTLVADDGSLVSLVELTGVRSLMGENELQHLADQFAMKMGSFVDQQGYAIQILFTFDPDRGRQEVARQLRPLAATAGRIGIDVNDVLEDRVRKLSRYAVHETCYAALWTRTSVLRKEEVKRIELKRKGLRKMLPQMAGKQDILRAADVLVQRHRIFVDAFEGTLRAANFDASVLEVHAALGAVRDVIYPGSVDVKALKRVSRALGDQGSKDGREYSSAGTWRPYVPGDKFRHTNDIEAPRADAAMWPSLSGQIFTAGYEYEDGTDFVKIDGRIWATSHVTLGPTEPMGFTGLLNAMTRVYDEDGSRIPFRIAFLLESAGMNAAAIKQLFGKILTVTNSDNKKFTKALDSMREMIANDVDKAISLRVSAATWAKEGEVDRLRGRLSALQQGIEQWGGMQTSNISGDEVEGLMSSALALDVGSVAPRMIAPFKEVIYMLPWARPAAPVDDGSILFRYPDGKLYPHTPGKRSQMVVQLVFGPPGRGKSVLLNQLNIATILSARAGADGKTELPRVSIIDIGPSASGLISLLRDSLPADRVHEAVFHRLNNIPEDAINPFDTQLGCRRPTPLERSFLINFLTLLATPQNGTGKPYDGTIDLVSRVVDKVYEACDPDVPGSPAKAYAAGAEPIVDRKLDEHRIVLPAKPKWWDVVDALAEVGAYREAEMAQKRAVPTLEQCTMAANDATIKEGFKETRASTTEPINEAFSRMITSAIQDIKILGGRTRIDFAGARVVVLDIDRVAGKSNTEADTRRTAITYMLARKALASDFYIGLDEVKLFPPKYQLYHQARIQKLREQPKRIHFDEFHRTSSAQAVREQVILDIREGRKFGVEIVLASQMVDDFDAAMVELSTEVFVLGAGSGDMGDRASDIFKLSPFARYHVNNHLVEPGEHGGFMVVKLSLDNGSYEQFLMNTLGPTELWAFSTTPVDAVIRQKLYERIGPVAARRALARRYPGGSAVKDADRRQEIALSRGGLVKTDVEIGVVEEIVNELVKMSQDSGGGRK